MIDFEIISHTGNYKIFVSKIKYFYTDDFNIRRSIINTFDGFFSKEKDSEFAKENNFTSKIFSDGKLLNIHDFEYYKISDDFDFKNELKLGPKSLISKYLEIKTQKLEYTENYQTLQYILHDLEEDLQEIISSDMNHLKFNIHIELEKKQILKFIALELIKTEFFSNSLDVTYDELIRFQFDLLLTIAKESKSKTLIIIDIPYLQNAWLNTLKSFPNTTYILLFNLNFPCILDPKNVFICSSALKVDLYDDNEIYDLCMNENKNYSLDEYRDFLINQLNNKI